MRLAHSDPDKQGRTVGLVNRDSSDTSGCESVRRFSVVIPLYNKARYIEQTLQSVLGQTFNNFEVVVVDDGSTDGGGGIVQACGDPRVKVVRQPNGGVARARNRGITESGASFIAFLDADDEWGPTFLQTIDSLIAKFPSAAMYGTSYRVTEGRLDRRAMLRELPDDWEGILTDYFRQASQGDPPICSSAVCIRRDALNKVGGFPAGIHSGQDLLTWARIALKHSIAYRNSACANYRLDTENSLHSSCPDEDHYANWYSLLGSGPPFAGLPDGLTEYVARLMLLRARSCILYGRKREARCLIRKCKQLSHDARRRRILLALSYVPSRILRVGFEWRLKHLGRH